MNQKHDILLAKIFQAAAKPAASPAERDKVADSLNKFLKQLEEEELKKAVRSIFTFLQARRKALTSGELLTPPFAMLELLRNTGFLSSVSAVFAAMDQELAELEFEHIKLLAFRESIIDNWLKRKAGKDEEILNSLKERLFELAISDPQFALSSDLYLWFSRNLDAKRLTESKPLLVAAAARHHLKAAEMFAFLVAKDKSGDFVIDWISDGEERLKRLVELSEVDSKLFDALQKGAPAWLKHGKANLLVGLYTGMHSKIGSRTGNHRAESVAQLLYLAGALLPLVEYNEAAASILQNLQTISLTVWKEAESSPDRRHTWAIVQAGNQTVGSTEATKHSNDDAKHLGIAIMRARKGKDALLELESALINMGGSRFGELGETITYDATIHNDLEGGLLPGNQVIIVRCGFHFGKSTLVKADVIEPAKS